MPLVITNPTHVPPGGSYRSVHPISGAEFRAHTPDGVLQKYNAHSRANGYPEATARDIELNICEHTKANICEESDSPTFGQVVANFTDSMFQWAKSGFGVSKEVAAARLAICQGCEHWTGLLGGSYLDGGCRRCGCSGVKLLLSGQRCPINKWQE